MEKQLVIILGVLVLAACGSLKVRDKDENAVSSIKKVAIAAFSEFQPASAGIGLNLNNGSTHATAGGSLIAKSDARIDRMYGDLRLELQRNMSWTVIDREALSANPEYIKAYKRTMEGLQNKMPPSKGQNQFLVKGIMDYQSMRILGPQGRDALIDGLGVDAIIVSKVNVILNGTTVMGIGSHHPQSHLSFEVFTKGNERSVWFDGDVEGDESEASVGKTGFIDEDLLTSLAEVSAKSAFVKIGKN